MNTENLKMIAETAREFAEKISAHTLWNGTKAKPSLWNSSTS